MYFTINNCVFSLSKQCWVFLVSFKSSHGNLLYMINFRLNSQSFSSLDCKMRWSPRYICNCCMPRQLFITGNAYSWNFQLECIWILGCQVEITTGELYNCFLNSMFQRRKKKINHLKMKIFRVREAWSHEFDTLLLFVDTVYTEYLSSLSGCFISVVFTCINTGR